MTENNSWLAELFARRIPQILGVYIASVWLGVEVSEWMTERFNVPDKTSSYVAVIMISFLPLVGLLAWGHGRPGKDKWTQKQLIFIPFNILIAYFAVTAFIKPDVSAIETMRLTDVQTGEVVDYEVAKSGLSQKVAGFFWENTTGDDSLDWLSYGAMWMVAKDLTRNPVFSIRTPYDSVSMLSEITSKSFSRATGEPLSLNLNIANDIDAQWLIKGRITQSDSQTGFEASLYQVNTGELVTTISSTYDDWLYALNDIADQLSQVMLKQAGIKLDKKDIPDMAISQYLSSDLKAIESIIDSLNAVRLDNDFDQGVKYLKNSLALDSQLAESYVLLIEYYRAMGDIESAKAAAEAALNLDYNLSQESALKVKANYYGTRGETDKAIKVLENWVKLYPESADALMILGANYMMVGHRLDDALQVYQKLIDLQQASSTALINTANIYRLKGDLNQAIKTLQIFQTQNPDKARPHLEMADTYLQFGDINAAKLQFEDASLISINDIKADLGLAKIKFYEGDFDGAIDQLNQLETKAQTPNDVLAVLGEKEMVLFQSGQLNGAMQLLNQMKKVSESFMPPLSQNMMFGSKLVSYLAYLGRFDESWLAHNQMVSESKPPFNEMLELNAIVLHELAGEHDLAAEALERFEAFLLKFQMNIYNQFVLNAKAMQAKNKGDFNGAIKFHDQAINESAQSFITLNSYRVVDGFKYYKAKTLFEAKKYEACIEVLNQVLQRYPVYAEALVLKAKSLFQLGELSKAKVVSAKARKIWATADDEFSELNELKELEKVLSEVE